MLLSQRSCHLLTIDSNELSQIVTDLRKFLIDERIPEEYTVKIYKDQVTCCGEHPVGVAIMIEGPKMPSIRSLNDKIYQKINEICKRRGVDYHECTRPEVLEEINETVFSQGET